MPGGRQANVNAYPSPDPTPLRLALLGNGYTPVPVCAPGCAYESIATGPCRSPGKVPHMSGWVKGGFTDAAVRTWPSRRALETNTGILCGRLIAVDGDILDPALAAKLEALAEALLGPTPLRRIGRAPKWLRCYRVAEPLRKMETPELVMPDGTVAQIEVLGEGQQFVAYGVHPDTGRPYTWQGAGPDTVPLDDLPVVTPDALRGFLAAAEALIVQAGGKKREKPRAAAAEAETTPPPRSEAKPAARKEGTFFRTVNDKALAALDRWVPAVLPKARKEAGTGAWRVSSADLGRDLQEDLSLHPTEGGKDWGTDEACTAIDVVIAHGGATDATEAAFRLCDQLGLDPAALGFKGKRQPGSQKAEAAGQPGGPARAPRTKGEQQAVDAVVDDFNARYMVVNEAGKAVIYQPGYDVVLKRRRFDRLAFRDLQNLYLNDLIQVGVDDKGRAIWKTAADVWLRHKRRRQFIGGVVFDPSTTAARPGILNLWEGFAVQPREGDWSLMREHIRAVICDGDHERFSYLRGWMARMVQHPAEQGEVAVVMKGGEGTGKGTLAKALMHITGHHGLAISNAKHLVGNFNAHLRDTVFLFADEALFAGDRAHVGALKSLITEPYLTVEGKFQNAVQTPNFLHVMMASNEEWVVPASMDARRFFVLEVNESRKGNHAYFAAIWEQMKAGGYEAMLHDLLAINLDTFNVRAVPVTEGLQRQKKLSLPTAEAWWLDCLERGYVFKSKLGLESYFGIWHEKVATELLFASYLEFAKGRGERRILTREGLGRFLAGLNAAPCRWRNGVVGEHVVEEVEYGRRERKTALVRQDRPPGYDLGALDMAREAFIKTTGLDVSWDSGQGWDELDAEAA